MKIRKGFVSNSSSSSFILGIKGKLTEDKLVKSFKVEKESPLYELALGIAECMCESSKKYKDIEEYMDDHCYLLEEVEDDIKDLFNTGYSVYKGYASDECSGPYETALCYMGLNYKDDDLIIKKESGY